MKEYSESISNIDINSEFPIPRLHRLRGKIFNHGLKETLRLFNCRSAAIHATSSLDQDFLYS